MKYSTSEILKQPICSTKAYIGNILAIYNKLTSTPPVNEITNLFSLQLLQNISLVVDWQ